MLNSENILQMECHKDVLNVNGATIIHMSIHMNDLTQNILL